MTYHITRYYQDPKRGSKIIKEGLTLKQAQEHCNDPETCYRTCKKPENVQHTIEYGPLV